MDPAAFDFSGEWSKYWLRRLRELLDEEIALKKSEIRKKLDLSVDYYPRSSSSRYNEPTSSSSFENSRMESKYSANSPEEEQVDDEPLTIISVLRLLAALEDLLGVTLGKKVLDLLSKAVHLEKVQANLADQVLMNEENSVLLDTVKEKLKGLIIADIVSKQQSSAVRRAIRNVESIVAVIDEKVSLSKVTEEIPSEEYNYKGGTKKWTNKQKPRMDCERKGDNRTDDISKQIATAFLIQKINISKERLDELTNNYILQSRESSETPYLFGVRMSQNEIDYSGKSYHTSSHSSSHIPQQSSNDGSGSGFAFNSFSSYVSNPANTPAFSSMDNSRNCNSFSNRRNNLSDSYQQQHNSSQSRMISNQSNQKYRSSDQFNKQNSSYAQSQPQQNNQQSHQRFHQQNSSNPSHNSTNKHMNNKMYFNQQKQLQIWDSDTIMGSQSNSQAFEIWDTNPMQSQGSFQQNSQNYLKYQPNPPSQLRTNTRQPVWDHQFSQQQNNRNNRHH